MSENGNENNNNRSNNNCDKVALVTGSATGIGANIAVDLATLGYKVIVTGRNLVKLMQVVKQCNEAAALAAANSAKKMDGYNGTDGSEAASAVSSCNHDETGGRQVVQLAVEAEESTRAFAFVADLYDFAQVDGLIDFVRTKFNRLDVLINNACFRGTVKSVVDPLAYDDLTRVMHMNVAIPTYIIHKCLVPLQQSTASTLGVAINISSVAAQLVVPLHLYSISKACLSEMSRQVAQLSQQFNIRSITISPGPVLTNERPHHAAMSRLTLMKRVGTTQEISNLVIFAIQNAHLFNGKEINIDGGYAVKSSK